MTVYSRRRNVLNEKFGYIADALEKLPDETVLDGEIVAVDAVKSCVEPDASIANANVETAAGIFQAPLAYRYVANLSGSKRSYSSLTTA